MTDRYDALVVVLEEPLRTDDAEALISAIQRFRGVLKVEGHVGGIDQQIANAQAKREMLERLLGEVVR